MSAMPKLAQSPLRAGAYPALVLNADYRPLSAFPLSTWPWKDAIHAVLNDRVYVAQEYEQVCRSASLKIRLPSVIVLKDYKKAFRTPAFTRYNVLLRDQYCCAYCGQKFAAEGLTYEHVIPRCQGGETTWTNIVLACHACNGRKGGRTPDQAGMTLQWRPWQPTVEDLARIGMRYRSERLHEGWRDFLYWDSELEK